MVLLFYNLSAINPAKNLHRFYKIEAGRDLFSQWYVSLYYGRKGTKGGRKNHSFETEQEALDFVDKTIAKKCTFQKHRGCAYTLIEEEQGPRPFLG